MDISVDNETSRSLDIAGVTMSGLCAAHCLMMPIAGSLLPSVTQLFENEWIHLGLLALLVPVALISFVSRKKVHKNSLPLIIGGAGIALLAAAVVSESLGPHILETLLTLCGSALLITAHIVNFKSELKARA
jgi:hypothetical protein